MRVLNDVLANATSGATDFNTAGISVEHIVYATVQVVWTGTLTGVATVQASCDDVASAADVTTWIDQSGKTAEPAGSAGSAMIHLTDMGYKWVRLKYVADGVPGAGTVTARIHGKGA